MDATKIERLKRFINDRATSDIVYELLLGSFLHPRKVTDVQFLAASRLAIDFLADAWRELEKLRVVEDKESKFTGNVGL